MVFYVAVSFIYLLNFYEKIRNLTGIIVQIVSRLFAVH